MKIIEKTESRKEECIRNEECIWSDTEDKRERQIEDSILGEQNRSHESALGLTMIACVFLCARLGLTVVRWLITNQNTLALTRL